MQLQEDNQFNYLEIPAGKIGGEWCFYKQALVEHLWHYHNLQTDNCPDFDEYNFEPASIKELLKPDRELVSQIINDYSRGRRVFEGLTYSKTIVQA